MSIRRTRTASDALLRITIDKDDGATELTRLPEPFSQWSPLALNPIRYFSDLKPAERKQALAKIILPKITASQITERLTSEPYNIPQDIAQRYGIRVEELGLTKAEQEAIEQRRIAKRAAEPLYCAPNPMWRSGDTTYNLFDTPVEAIELLIDEYTQQRDALLTEKGKMQGAKDAKAQVVEQTKAELSVEREALLRKLADIDQQDDPTAIREKIAALEKERAEHQRKKTDAENAIKVSDATERLTVPNLDFTICPVMDKLECPVPQEERRRIKKIFTDRQKHAKAIIEDSNKTIKYELSRFDACQSSIEELRRKLELYIQNEQKASLWRAEIRRLDDRIATAPDRSLPSDPPPRPIDDEIAAVSERLAVGNSLLAAKLAFNEALKQSQTALTASEAAKVQVDMYDRLATALSPNGIETVLLLESSERFQKRLRESATLLGGRIALDPDYLPLWDGHAYQFIANNEKWRAHAAMQDAIAYFSKVPYLILDGADILDADNRGLFSEFLLTRAADYDHIFVFSTLGERPVEQSSHPQIDVWSVTNGTVTKPPLV
jgi:hypothetical protein